jgi:hypothetical protein
MSPLRGGAERRQGRVASRVGGLCVVHVAARRAQQLERHRAVAIFASQHQRAFALGIPESHERTHPRGLGRAQR